MPSKYAKTIYRLLKKMYPVVWEETSLWELVHAAQFTPELLSMIRDAEVNLRQLHIDWYVPNIVAVEVHGEQHAKPIRFANSILDPEEALERRRLLDAIKAECLRQAGIPLVTIWYHDIAYTNDKNLAKKILKAQQNADRVPKQTTDNVQPPKFRLSKDRWAARKIPNRKKKWPTRQMHNRKRKP